MLFFLKEPFNPIEHSIVSAFLARITQRNKKQEAAEEEEEGRMYYFFQQCSLLLWMTSSAAASLWLILLLPYCLLEGRHFVASRVVVVEALTTPTPLIGQGRRRQEQQQSLWMKPLLSPSSKDSSWFDTTTVAHPVILPPPVVGDSGVDVAGEQPAAELMWKCFYYGRGETWKCNETTTPFLPTGWIGMAESDHGAMGPWTKVPGDDEAEGFAILAPTGNPKDWDGVHIGVGDVIRRTDLHDNKDNTTLDMYYFGGSGASLELSPNGPKFAGMDMQIGRARSTDNGRSWKRLGLCLERDPSEGLFCAFPKVCCIRHDFWRMFYHSFDGQEWTAYTAISHNQGDSWIRQGKVLEKGPQGNWDDRGIGCRAVLPWTNKEIDNNADDSNISSSLSSYLMVYEGVSWSDGKHRLGVAHGQEQDNGTVVFTKDTTLSNAPGGPIVEPGQWGPWTSNNVGTPYLVQSFAKNNNHDNDNGKEENSQQHLLLHLYFVCTPNLKDPDSAFGIGGLVCPNPKENLGHWEALEAYNIYDEEKIKTNTNPK